MKKKSILFREGNLIKVISNNTKNIFVFDNNEEIFNKLNGKHFYEKGHYLCYTKNYKKYFAHHLILPKKEGYLTDHINRNTRDNRKANLRYVTSSENHINRGLQGNNTSGITGVHWDKLAKKWKVYINIEGNRIHLGRFTNVNDAIVRRLAAEMILFPGIKYKGEGEQE